MRTVHKIYKLLGIADLGYLPVKWHRLEKNKPGTISVLNKDNMFLCVMSLRIRKPKQDEEIKPKINKIRRA